MNPTPNSLQPNTQDNNNPSPQGTRPSPCQQPVDDTVMNETINQASSQIKPSRQDKVIGAILGSIGIVWTLFVILSLVSYYRGPSRSLAPPYINLLIPFLLIYSGHYYLFGRNAARIARKQNKSDVHTTGRTFGKAEIILCLAIVGIFVGLGVAALQGNQSPTASTSPSSTDAKRTAVANNLNKAELQYQKDNGDATWALDRLGVDYTNPATGKHYMFGGALIHGQTPELNAIHSDLGYVCSPNDPGYMVPGQPSNFAFAIERETMPPICFSY